MSDRVLERTIAQGPLQTLTRAELQLDLLPCTTDPRPRPVRAWVRFGATPVQVDAEACMWTPRAVAIRFRVGTREYRCWVWTNAVDPAP
ncbi:hypothetical protein [Microbacterium invictum]|uniref:Uncharacterized protein n=1 Tax=Microbacterium invictum TaxID=515415 RepID=A0ABZ0V7D4_9MICO|nr:hypothetical protein [Microbacterium invictum]WQB69019.1 hypothetical protein T9R20_09855 [Microbacterium invictum]